jgi:outer membrane lipoprotein-sorting protein
MKILIAVLCALLGAVKLPAENLEIILAHMDEAAPAFKAAAADIQLTTFTKVIGDKTVENGTFKMQRLKDKGTRVMIDFSNEKDARVIFFSGKIVRMYLTKAKLYQDFDVGKSDALNEFLLLGFGSSGKELTDSYEISISGTENIAGQETTKLVLLPKSAKAKEKLSKVAVWIPVGGANPIQQQFYYPSGNYQLVLYSNLKLNPPIKVEFKLPAGAKKQGS